MVGAGGGCRLIRTVQPVSKAARSTVAILRHGWRWFTCCFLVYPASCFVLLGLRLIGSMER